MQDHLFDWEKFQTEHQAWCKHNFGERPAWQPVLGISEEIGELAEAATEAMREDAIADVAIFSADVISILGIQLKEIDTLAFRHVCRDEFIRRRERKPGSGEEFSESYYIDKLIVANGKIAHHILKMEQGIRGTREEHIAGIRAAFIDLFRALYHLSDLVSGKLLEEIVDPVWQKVRLRDWKKDAKDAGGHA